MAKKIMYETYLGQKMIADHNGLGGGVFFELFYLEWKPRNYRYKDHSFKVYYKDITKVELIDSFKKRVILHTASGKYTIDLYRVDTFLYILDQAREKNKEGNPEDIIEVPVEDESPVSQNLSELERLAKLHESGALTDEEFKLAKEKILAKL